tara:strand:- start:2705 stop:2878 length:174 start_codon:yes stop_codon:yes gene_type:complete
MEICIGMIGMQPTEFWNASPNEVYAAIEGFREFNTSNNEKPMSKNELEKLMELHPDE